MNENEEKVVLPFRPEITFTIEKKTLQNFFDVLAKKIAEKTAEKLAEFFALANQNQTTEAPAEAPKADDILRPYEPETEGGEK